MKDERPEGGQKTRKLIAKKQFFAQHKLARYFQKRKSEGDAGQDKSISQKSSADRALRRARRIHFLTSIGENLPVLCTAAGLAFLLIIAFGFLPTGWNIIPLVMIGLLGIWAKKNISFPRADEAIPTDEAARGQHEEKINQDDPPPSEPAAVHGADTPPSLAWRLHRALAPVAAGIVIDLVDLSTFGQMGLILGFPLGSAAGAWMGFALGLKRKFIVILAFASGIYCMIPGTEFIPIATIVGACFRFWESTTEKNKQ